MTHRFYNILFAALNDDSQPPAHLSEAVEFARTVDARMLLFDAIPPISRIQRHLRLADTNIANLDVAADARRAELRSWAHDEASRLRMGVSVGAGRRSVEIARQVVKGGHDLVVIAPNGTVEDLSVVRRLIRTVPCPLLVLKGSFVDGNVIAAVDPDDELSLNVMIARSAQAVASIRGSTVHFVHAYEPHAIETMRSVDIAALTGDRIDAFADRARDAHRSALDELVERVGRPEDIVAHVDVGSPLDVVARSAVEFGASLVVIGAGGARGMPSVLIGHTAERVATKLSVSTLVVKAPGLATITDDIQWMNANATTAVPAVA